MAEKKYSIELEGLFGNIETLTEEAKLGKYEAIQRLGAIKKLANPIFEFSPSDYRRILDKKLPRQVKKGLKLYEMMRQLSYLVQPAGKRKGAACAVRRVDYESLTWEEFLELRGTFSAGFIMEAIKQRAAPKFIGLEMLNEKQIELYQRIKVYFGNKKKPTLQSLAMNLLSEETDGKDFSERSLYIYREAINEYRKRRKKSSGFDLNYLTFQSIAAFNDEEETVRESIEGMDKSSARLAGYLNSKILQISQNLVKDTFPQLNINLAAQAFKDLIPQFAAERTNELLRSTISNLPRYDDLPQNEDAD